MTVKQERLQGWNAIADYLECDVRTAKRWEEQRGLPVRRTRRTPGEGRANVYALIAEIEAWRAGSSAAVDNATQVSSTQIRATPVNETDVAKEGAAPEDVTRSSRMWLAGAALVVCLTVVAALWAHGRAKAAHAERISKAAAGRTLAHAREPEVQDLYLHGTYLLEQRTPETLAQAQTDFEQAITLDAGFAPAYAGLAETYDLLREYSTVPSGKAYPLAKQAAERAIALDPKLADAHAALGYEEFFWEWDKTRAEAEFRRAIGLDANSVNAAHWYGAMLMHEARFREALEQLNRAQMLEPASASVLATRAYAIGLSGRRDEAADLLQDILTRVPNGAPLHFILAQLCLQEPRDIPRYLDQMRRFSELRHSGEELQMIDAAEPAYRARGETAMWRAMLDVEERLHTGEHTYQMAEMEAALGMNDAAIRDLTVLEQRHDDHMIGLAIDTMLTPLRGDARFKALERQVGLPEVSAR